MAIPEWLTIEPEEIARDCGLACHQFAVIEEIDGVMQPRPATQADFETIISGHLTTSYPRVTGPCRLASQPVLWPFSDAVMAIAYPDESPEARTETVDGQKGNAQEALRAMVYAKLYYTLPADTYRATADAHWRNSQAIITALTKEIGGVVELYQSLASVNAFFLPETVASLE